jgi:DNA-binding CsgD family transcriptional regulator
MAQEAEPALVEELTPREAEVLDLVRRGFTNGQIARQLGVSADGAKYHVSQIIAKLGVRNRYEAAVWPERPPWWTAGLAPAALLWRRLSVGWLARGASAVAAVGIAAGIGLLVWGLLRTSGGNAGTAFVYVGGTIDSISDQQLVVRDLEGQLVPIHVEHAEGPEAQFCDHRTPIPMCMVRSEASPSKGEGVCVMARLMPAGELIAWLVHLDSQCRQVPAPTSVPTP